MSNTSPTSSASSVTFYTYAHPTTTSTPARGAWYQPSWKGDTEKSGGLIMNIGVHLFDLLIWIFGEPLNYWHNQDSQTATGEIKLERAQVSWLLSINPGYSSHNPAQQP